MLALGLFYQYVYLEALVGGSTRSTVSHQMYVPLLVPQFLSSWKIGAVIKKEKNLRWFKHTSARSTALEVPENFKTLLRWLSEENYISPRKIKQRKDLSKSDCIGDSAIHSPSLQAYPPSRSQSFKPIQK